MFTPTAIERTILLPDLDSPDVVYRVTIRVDTPLEIGVVKETLAVWYRTARLLRNGVTKESETYYMQRHNVPTGEIPYPAMTAHGSVPSAKTGQDALRVTVTELITVQEALDMAWSVLNAEKDFKAALMGRLHYDPSQIRYPQSTNHRAPSANGQVIPATRPPNKKRVDYPQGQQVSFVINKIEVGSGNNTVLYKLWGPLGRQYPITFLYEDNASHMAAAEQVLQSLNLGIGKGLQPSASGKWELIMQASIEHKDDESFQYLNPIQLRSA